MKFGRCTQRFLIPIVLIARTAIAAEPASPSIDQELQNWMVFTAQGPLSKSGKWRGYFEAQPRTSAENANLDRLLLRPAVSYKIGENTSAWVGYTRVSAHDNRNLLLENRTWEQVLTQLKKGKVTWVSRSRLEQRYFEGLGESPVGHRLRELVRAVISLQPKKDRPWSLVAANEVFMNFNTVNRGQKAGFDQNRLFVGVSRKLTKQLTLEAGYMNNYVHRPFSPSHRLNHNATATLAYDWGAK